MKMLIAAALMLCSTALFAEPLYDSKYAALLMWSMELSQKAQVWNNNCRDTPTTAECDNANDVLHQLATMFVTEAKLYRRVGTDANSDLRVRVIEHEVKVFVWNDECGGRTQAKEAHVACEERRLPLDLEEEKLKQEIKACAPSEKL